MARHPAHRGAGDRADRLRRFPRRQRAPRPDSVGAAGCKPIGRLPPILRPRRPTPPASVSLPASAAIGQRDQREDRSARVSSRIPPPTGGARTNPRVISLRDNTNRFDPRDTGSATTGTELPESVAKASLPFDAGHQNINARGLRRPGILQGMPQRELRRLDDARAPPR